MGPRIRIPIVYSKCDLSFSFYINISIIVSHSIGKLNGQIIQYVVRFLPMLFYERKWKLHAANQRKAAFRERQKGEKEKKEKNMSAFKRSFIV